MAIEKITNSTQLSRWAEIINEINDATVTNAESIINSVGSVYTFTQRIDTDGSEPDNSESFEQALARFLVENEGIEFKKNDVAIVTLVDASNEGTTYEMAAYIYDGEKLKPYIDNRVKIYTSDWLSIYRSGQWYFLHKLHGQDHRKNS